MATIVADTHKLIQDLRQKGYSKEQAEGFAQALQELNLSELATKTDLARLENNIIKWLIGVLVAQTAVIVAVLSFFIN
ncbi:MAG: CCDC90 family protein [Pirellulales bacterium]|nr:CCDC90 family protein [Pirellulales bacterium]